MYLRGKEEVPCPDGMAGLHIRARDNQVVRATIGPDELAFQVHLARAVPRSAEAAWLGAAVDRPTSPRLVPSNASLPWP